MDTNRHFFVIVNYNSGSGIIHCIQSIMRSKNIHPIIVIVDNASTDQSLERCKIKYPNLVYIYNTHNVGFAAAANVGTRYAIERNAQTVTYCNPDAFLAPECAHLLISAVLDDHYAIVSPQISHSTSKKTWFRGGKIDFLHFRAVHAHTVHDLSKNIIPSDFISGCVMTVSAHTYKKIGLFDERFFLYYEDVDFSLRARKSSLRIGVVINAHAFHDEISEQRKDLKTYFLVLSGLLFFAKHTHGLTKIWFKTHLWLRKIKNHFDRKKSQPLAQSVYKAFIDYASIT